MVDQETTGANGRSIPPTKRRYFYVLMAALLLCCVLVGFSPTFFIDAISGELHLPVHLTVHALVLTGWFLLFLVQPLLIATNQKQLHRGLGAVGVLLACAVVITSILTIVGFIPRLRSNDIEVADNLAFLTVIIWGNIAQLIAFPVLMTRAVLMRHRPDVHRRLMLLAAISLVLPALARVSRIFGVPEPIFVLGSTVFLLVTLTVYDVVIDRHIHHETIWGAPFLLLLVVTCTAIGASPIGQSIIGSM